MAVKYNPDDYHTKSFIIIRLIERLRVGSIIRALRIKSSDTVLEIGCGAGNILERITKGKIFGADLSWELLTLAKTKIFSRKPNLFMSYGESLPFKESSFDKIICSEVLEHVPDPKLIRNEAWRVIKKEGRFVYSVPNEKLINDVKKLLSAVRLNKVLSWFGKYEYSPDMTDEWHLHSFGPKTALELAGDKFDIDTVRYIPCRFFPVRIVVACRKNTQP